MSEIDTSTTVRREGSSENFLRKVCSGIAFDRLVRGEWRIRSLRSQTDLLATGGGNESNYGFEIILRSNSFLHSSKSSTDLNCADSLSCRSGHYGRAEECCRYEEPSSSLMSSKKHPSKQYGLNFDETDDPMSTEADLKFAATIARVDEALLVGGDSFSPNIRGTWAFGTLVVLFIGVCANKMLNVTNIQQSSYSLAPAAIQTVTDVLGPILPFTGGVDLRRDDVNIWQLMLPDSVAESWEMRWHKFGSTSATQNKQSQTPTEIGTIEGQTTLSLSSRTTRWTKEPKRDVVISASDSFLPPEKISQLTLDGLTYVFQYALQVNRPEFDKEVFLASLDQNMLAIVNAMDSATGKSRGENVLIARARQFDPVAENVGDSPVPKLRFGDIDTLYFCAAMRIFAEWRMLRQVPEGYKGYEVGMSLGRKDCVQNLVKVEHAAHHWIDERIEFLHRKRITQNESTESEDSALRSPSLRELLHEEAVLNVHEKLPRLKEKSAAMGLLWVRRQLNYQIAIFDHINSGKHSSAEEAVLAAYRDVYSNFHGWAVQKIFGYSFQAAPPVESILKLMHKDYYEIILEQSKTYTISSEQLTATTSDDDRGSSVAAHQHNTIFVDTNSTLQQTEGDPLGNFLKATATEFSKIGNYVSSEMQKIGTHIAGEWDKMATNVLRLVRIGNGERSNTSPLSASHKRSVLEGDALEKYISNKLLEHNNRSLNFHFEVVKPLLQDLAGLFDEFNMDDPAKV